MHILVCDIGGTSVKMLVTGETERRKAPSGPEMTAAAPRHSAATELEAASAALGSCIMMVSHSVQKRCLLYPFKFASCVGYS